MKIKDKIIEGIKYENKYPLFEKSRNCVWFSPDLGCYLYSDLKVDDSIVNEMIKDKILIYQNIETYQNENMHRYILNPNL